MLYKDKILILDFQFIELKCIDWSTLMFNYVFTQVSEDVKYIGPKLEVFIRNLGNWYII